MALKKPVTLKQIAEQANVSVAAVSYALRGTGRMSAAMRSRLEQMLKDAGYRPSYKLRPVLYLNTHNFFADMHVLGPMLAKYEGISRCFHAEDVPFRMELLHMPGSPSLAQQLEQLLSFRPSGVLLDSELSEDMPAVVEFFRKAGVPIVQLGQVLRVPSEDAIIVDNFGGAHSAVQHLILQGHRKIASIRWNVARDSASGQKHAGFRCAMEEHGIRIPDSYIVETPLGRSPRGQPGRIAVEQLLALPDPPTAVFVENSFVSPSLLYPLAGESVVPRRIAELEMVHFEAWSLGWIEQVAVGKFSMPECETKLLRSDWSQIGRAAADRLMAKLGGDQSLGKIIRVSPSLVKISKGAETPIN